MPGKLVGYRESRSGDEPESGRVFPFEMERNRLAQALDQFVQRAALADHGKLEALADVPTATATNDCVNDFSRRRVGVERGTGPRFGGCKANGSGPGTTVGGADLVHAPRHPTKVVQPVCVVRGRVDAATTHDVCEHRSGVQVRESQDDLARAKPPVVTPATDPASRAEDLLVHRHADNIQV
jgi:hypothetical protein